MLGRRRAATGQIEPANGKVQLPVWSIRKPNTTGEMIPATPKPKFIIPLADPE
jgi:hypothetical protein